MHVDSSHFKLCQRHKVQHEQPNIVHDARQRWVAWRWEARLAPRPPVERPPVQPDSRSNRQQALDPFTLVAREPVGVAMHLEAPKVSVDLNLESVVLDVWRERVEGEAADVRCAEDGNHAVWC